MGHHRLAMPDLGRIFRGEAVAGLSEWQLLERYLERRDEVAFEALVARHGPMVLGVCRRMLADRTDVEDAFQATFLVLVRRARHLGPRDAIGPWLYGVATRVALQSRSQAARRRRVEPLSSDFEAVVDDRSIADREIADVIDQELNRLPPKYRRPIVLCYLEGQTHEEAARQLKWPIGTVKGRLARARDLLRSRLIRRGLTPAVGAVSLGLSPDSPAALHRELLDRTVKSSLKLAAGQTTAQIVSTSITSLVEGVLTSMFLNSLKWTGAVVLAGGLALTSIGVMARQDAAAKKADAPPAQKTVAAKADPKARAAIDPSKPAAEPADTATKDDRKKLADLQHELTRAAQMEWQHAYKDYLGTNTGLERAYQASRRLMDARQAAAATSPNEKVSAVTAHLERIRDIARIQHANPSSSDLQSAQVRAYAAEAELWIAQAKASEGQKDKEEIAGPVSKAGQGKDPKSQLILAKLDEPISMSFADDTPLGDILKYVKQATTTKTYQGIPIYVDPVGLQEAEKSMNSTVRNMDLEGVPLRRTLQLLLKPLDLIYFVEDGILYITSAESEGTFGAFAPAMAEPSPILQKVEKAERGELSVSEMQELLEILKTREQIMKLSGGEGGHRKDVAQSNKENDEAKQDRETMKQLLTEMRELIQVLKAERHTKNAAEDN